MCYKCEVYTGSSISSVYFTFIAQKDETSHYLLQWLYVKYFGLSQVYYNLN